MAVDFCRNLEQEFATIQRSAVIGNTNHQVSQTSRYKIGVDLSRNLEAEFETVQGGGQTRTFFLNNAEADTNLAIRRSQRLTFQKGKAVVNSQQLIIDNIQNDKVVSMPALTGIRHHRRRLAAADIVVTTLQQLKSPPPSSSRRLCRHLTAANIVVPRNSFQLHPSSLTSSDVTTSFLCFYFR
nr:hypothetical protein Iba_chr10aCG14840 [Ipomoea batatas]